MSCFPAFKLSNYQQMAKGSNSQGTTMSTIQLATNQRPSVNQQRGTNGANGGTNGKDEAHTQKHQIAVNDQKNKPSMANERPKSG